MLVWKEIIRPGVYYYTDQETGLPRKLVATPDLIRHFHDSGKKMLEFKLSIPTPLEHQPTARAMTQAEKAASQLLNNAGEMRGYRLQTVLDDVTQKPVEALFGQLDIQDDAVARKLGRTIRWVSPWITSFVDGDGRQWNGVISHVALTSRPRITRQQPFPSVAAAMAFAVAVPEEKEVGSARGLSLSRAGLLVSDGATLRPAYPLAFSLWSGAALADDDLMAAKKKPPAKPDAKPEATPDAPPVPDAGADQPGGAATPPTGPDGMPVEKSLVDPDGDMDATDVLCDLLDAVGISIEPGDEASFPARAYKALMGYIKTKSQGASMADPNMTNQPPGGKNPNNLPPNPVVMEQPPMYMSLEQAQAIPDPTLRQIALSLLSQRDQTEALKKAAFEEAKAKRQQRLDRLTRRLPKEAREQLVQLAAGAQFSLGTDGVVADSLATTLDILDAGIRDMPGLLTQQAGVEVVPHPREYDGEMSEERRKAVVDEIAANVKLPPAQ